jgi:hypothetical protein
VTKHWRFVLFLLLLDLLLLASLALPGRVRLWPLPVVQP